MQPDSRELLSIRILANLTPTALTAIAARCRVRLMTPGEIIVRYQDRDDSVFFQLSGRSLATILSPEGRELAFTEIAPGSYFGELAALTGAPRSATVRTIENSRLAILPGPDLTELIAAHPSLAQALIGDLASRVQGLTRRCVELATRSVETRLRSVLVQLASRRGALHSGVKIEPAPTHAELAARVGSEREVVTRALRKLANQNIVSTSRQAIVVLDVEGLKQNLELDF